MRTRDAFLILRFVTWPPAIAGLFLMLVLGLIVKSCGLNEPRDPSDRVCIGAQEYDLSKPSDKAAVLENLAQWGADPAKALQRPPCDMLGSPVSKKSIDKLFSRQ